MQQVNFFSRKKNPDFFSIEQLFETIAGNINANAPKYGVHVNYQTAPFFSSLPNILKNISFVRGNQGSVNHITGDIHYTILGCSNKNLNVLTIHDCVLLTKFSKLSLKYWIFRWLWYDLPMKKADVITVISEKTKEELHKLIGHSQHKIKVINNFIDPRFTYSEKTFDQSKPSLLFIGSTENKNLDRVLEAIKGINCKLEIIGKITDGQSAFIKNNNINVNIIHGVSYETVIEKYRQCDMLVYPSTYEGFGLPIIEANATGRPVLTSDLSPMKEVAGGAAVLVDPYNVEDIKNGIEKIITDGELRKTLVASGLQNARRFQIDEVVKEYVDVYNTR
ncbi:glycosyltransferase family 4 protein [Pinibacter aurantiacus]|uniref:Glycosyltransferase family 4 protein n=1 Tax=Pinibacter aurantiacus TaxID=2851599 RepID=A0A9E2SAH4_9BACT|nr:glycosyltransferase family 1 protein [Pinibacter aurantiacus]MBV4357868.1 glycosyltransferase family 4 protein [Pinibacter aurantiacus]